MIHPKPIVAIVDAYSTGKYLAPMLKEKGYSCIHIQSQEVIPALFIESFIKENFSENLIYKGDIEAISGALKHYKLAYIMPGTETGVELADLIGSKLNLPHNPTTLSLARRNKFYMIEAVKQANLATVQHFRTNKLDDLLAWQTQVSLNPIVLKPEKSAGADNVYFCYKSDEIKSSFNHIMQSKTIFDQPNEYVLAQSFLEGIEYIVNTVSSSGEHYIAEIWRCRKEEVPGAGYISLLEELIPFHSQAENLELAKYTKQILTALKIQHGAGHFEIMYTTNGPVLIEMGARLQGCVDPFIVSQATKGDSFVSLMLDSYLLPHQVQEKSKKHYSLDKLVYRIFMRSHKHGIISKTPDFQKIKELASFGSINCNIKIGDLIKPTRDIASTLGVIHLINEDPVQLENDYERYRHYEATGMFETA